MSHFIYLRFLSAHARVCSGDWRWLPDLLRAENRCWIVMNEVIGLHCLFRFLLCIVLGDSSR